MKRITLLLFLFFLAAVLAPAASDVGDDYVPFWWWGKNFSGHVEKITQDSVTVTGEGGTRTFEINAFTRIIMWGSPQLTPGMLVKVTYKETKQKLIAKAVREIREAQPAPSPTRTSEQ